MTFWEHDIDDKVLEVTSNFLGRSVDPLTPLSVTGEHKITLEELRVLQKAIEVRIGLDLPLFASDVWKSVGDVLVCTRATVRRARMAA